MMLLPACKFLSQRTSTVCQTNAACFPDEICCRGICTKVSTLTFGGSTSCSYDVDGSPLPIEVLAEAKFFDGSVDRSHATVDSSGNVFIVWGESDSTNARVFAGRYNQDLSGGSTKKLIAITGGYFDEPRIAVDGRGNALASWMSNARSTLHASRYVVETNTWGDFETVFPQGAFDVLSGQSVSLAESGEGIVVWSLDAGGVYAKRVVVDGGFSSTTTVSPSLKATGLRVAAGNDRTAMAAWRSDDAGVYGVVLEVVDGGWEVKFMDVVPVEADASVVAIATSPVSVAVGLSVWDALASDWVVYAARYVSPAGWSCCEPVDTLNTPVTAVAVAAGAGGQNVVSWSQRTPSEANIWASRSGADAGEWTSSLISATAVGTVLWTAVDPNGGALVGWESIDGLYVARSNRTGDVWTTPVKFAELGQGGTLPPFSAAMNAAGNGVVAWHEFADAGTLRFVVFR
ncbi:MAG: hypothetical protein HYY84_12155 [Deltaproteobacteria bacterium]|nr:hypothetical protein [Deltaproteobacteria bacterium]